jgi:hypothetical protein
MRKGFAPSAQVVSGVFAGNVQIKQQQIEQTFRGKAHRARRRRR